MLPYLARFCFLLLLAHLAGCVPKPSGVADLERYPQKAAAYLPATTAPARLITAEAQAKLDADYNERFFAPWVQNRASLPPAEAFWGINSYGNRRGFAENLLPILPERWQHLVDSLNQETYPSLSRPAITVRNTSVRIFPTARPFFLDPLLAGEGFPFDYFQHSALWAGTPLLVTHASADGAWYFVETRIVAGWLPALDLAWADETFRTGYQTGRYAALLRDDVTLRDETGGFLVQTHLGAVFPVTGENRSGLELLVPVRDGDGNAQLRHAPVTSEQAALKPLPLQPARIAELADGIIGEPYGWGGLYEDRDCSSTLRDLFAPFGLWLARNSEAQAKRSGTFHDLSGLDWREKRERLLHQGIPFYTLIWLKGHIGLYLGPDPLSGEPMLLHNLWGVRTLDRYGREGRAVVGRLTITTLRPGEERPDVEKDRFYERIRGMTILPGDKETEGR